MRGSVDCASDGAMSISEIEEGKLQTSNSGYVNRIVIVIMTECDANACRRCVELGLLENEFDGRHMMPQDVSKDRKFDSWTSGREIYYNAALYASYRTDH